MQIKEIIKYLEELAPQAYAEDFDNTGLLIGDSNTKVTNILVCLDTLESVIEEAIEKNCNFIVSFHPIIFTGLKKITGKNYVERTVLKAIKNDIAIFAIHTALDNSTVGVNAKICEKLGLENCEILIPQSSTIKKLTTFVPIKNAENLRHALFEAGAGNIGNYSNCSFSVEGTGSFMGNEQSNPVIGKKGETHFEKEMQIGLTYSKHNESKILKALFKNHPYEEVAYEITTLENKNQHIGMGMIGNLNKPMKELDFLKHVAKTMNAKGIRHSALLNLNVQKVAVLGGSGAFAIEAAKNAGANVFISADFKYHDFFKAENTILFADIGHFESEQFTKDLLVSFLKKKITNFAVLLSEINTNPISYL